MAPPFGGDISGSVEPNRREAGVWLRGAHKGFPSAFPPFRFLRENLNGAAGNDTGDRVRAMLARCSGPTGMKKRPDSRKLFERKNSNIHLQNDNFRTGRQTGPVRWLGFF